MTPAKFEQKNVERIRPTKTERNNITGTDSYEVERIRPTKTERYNIILGYVSRIGRAGVSELASATGTSAVTIRKDLDDLSGKGLLRREHGYAVPMDTDDINFKMAVNYDKKCAIARTASKFVNEGETILIEAGSTCVLFAEELVKSGKAVTIVTNSVHLANYINDSSLVNIILLGGNYQKKHQDVVGPLTKLCVQTFHFDKIFIGTDGFSKEYGFTVDDINRADTLLSMIKSAEHTVILTESDKFGKAGSVPFLKFDEVDELITDNGISSNDISFLKRSGIKVTLAE